MPADGGPGGAPMPPAGVGGGRTDTVTGDRVPAVDGAGGGGYDCRMPDDTTTGDERVASRAELLPEEEAVGSEDPEAQAEAVLADSDERTASRSSAPGSRVEHRTSEDTTPPAD